MGQVAENDIFYEPTDQVIVKEGEQSHQTPGSLERVAETARNAIAEKARRELDARAVEGSVKLDA